MDSDLFSYVYSPDGKLKHVNMLSEPQFALMASGYLWAWESCDWREATEEEKAAHMAGMQEAMAKAPQMMYRMNLPLVEG